MRLSKHPSAVQIMTDQKQPDNVKYFNCLRSMIKDDARCKREIKPRIAMVKAAFKNSQANWT